VANQSRKAQTLSDRTGSAGNSVAVWRKKLAVWRKLILFHDSLASPLQSATISR
jgi:hypothetical protein